MTKLIYGKSKRKFAGKMFTHQINRTSKKEAEQSKKFYKNKGYNVRVVRTKRKRGDAGRYLGKYLYQIWISRKRKHRSKGKY